MKRDMCTVSSVTINCYNKEIASLSSNLRKLSKSIEIKSRFSYKFKASYRASLSLRINTIRILQMPLYCCDIQF